MEPKPSNGEQAEVVTVEQLPQILGFIESEELSAIHSRIREVAPTGDEAQIRALMLQYSAGGEKVVEQKEGDDFPRAQVGFLIAKALLWKEAGREDYYPDDLQDALTYAENMGYEDVVPALLTAMEETESHIKQLLGAAAEVNTRVLLTPGKDGLPSIGREELIEQLGIADDAGNLLPGFKVTTYDDTGHIDIFYSGPDNEKYRAFFEKLRAYGAEVESAKSASEPPPK